MNTFAFYLFFCCFIFNQQIQLCSILCFFCFYIYFNKFTFFSFVFFWCFNDWLFCILIFYGICVMYSLISVCCINFQLTLEVAKLRILWKICLLTIDLQKLFNVAVMIEFACFFFAKWQFPQTHWNSISGWLTHSVSDMQSFF